MSIPLISEILNWKVVVDICKDVTLFRRRYLDKEFWHKFPSIIFPRFRCLVESLYFSCCLKINGHKRFVTHFFISSRLFGVYRPYITKNQHEEKW